MVSSLGYASGLSVSWVMGTPWDVSEVIQRLFPEGDIVQCDALEANKMLNKENKFGPKSREIKPCWIDDTGSRRINNGWSTIGYGDCVFWEIEVLCL